MAKFRCKVCGVEFEAPSLDEAVCPVCNAAVDEVELVGAANANP